MAKKRNGMSALMEAEKQRRISPRTDKGGSTAVGKVDYIRADVANLLYSWYLVRDCLAGEPAVKGYMAADLKPGTTGYISNRWDEGIVSTNLRVAQRYLPMPNSADQTSQNKARYQAYLERAIFYEVTARTLEGLCGEIFKRDPTVTLPTELEGMKIDADAAGLSLDECAYQATSTTISYGRCGVLVDFPDRAEDTTIADAADGVQPNISLYEPWNIPNWRVQTIDGKQKLTMVVLREFQELDDDDFALKLVLNYRVLRLTNGEYTSELFTVQEGGQLQSQGITTPKDGKGQPFKEINFKFIGASNNNVLPNRAPLYSLASVNIGHYRNSADYEDASFLCGQPTPVFMGLTTQWVKDVLKGGIELGSRAAVALPVGGNAMLLQAQANTIPFEAMGHKEEQMVSLGAKLVQPAQPGSGGKSATGEIMQSASEGSTLTNVAANVSAIFTWALKIAAQFMNVDPKDVSYALQQDFDISHMSADETNSLVQTWQNGAITHDEMRGGLKRSGLATDPRKSGDVLKTVLDEHKQLTKAGVKADPNKQNPRVPSKKAPSTAGGPQPGTRQRNDK